VHGWVLGLGVLFDLIAAVGRDLDFAFGRDLDCFAAWSTATPLPGDCATRIR